MTAGTRKKFVFGILLFQFALTPFRSTAQIEYGPFLNVYEENGLKGVINQDGKEIIPAQYEELGWSEGIPVFHDGVIGFKAGGKWGIISSANSITITAKYKRIYRAGSNLIVASKEGLLSGEEFYGIFNSRGKLIVPFSYAGLSVIGTTVIARKYDHNKHVYGLIDLNNTQLLPFAYPNIYSLTEKLLVVTRDNGKLSLVNTNGKEVLRFQIDSIAHADEDYFFVFYDGKAGLVDKTGRNALKPEFRKIEIANNSVSALPVNAWHLLSPDNTTRLVMYFDTIEESSQNVFITGINNMYRLTSPGEFITKKAYNTILHLSGSFYHVTLNGRTGIITKTGEELIELVYDSLYMDAGFIYVRRSKGRDSGWSVFDTLGIRKNLYFYKAVKPISEGLFAVKRNNRWGFMNRSGNEVIHCVFDSVTPFDNGKSIVVFHNEQGVIDKMGDWLILPEKKEITIINDTLYLEKTKKLTLLKGFDHNLIYFTEKELIVKDTYLEEKIDSVNTWFVSFQGIIFSRFSTGFTEHINFHDSLYIIKKGGSASVVSFSGRTYIPFGIYDDIDPPVEGLLRIKYQGFYGFSDLSGKLRVANRYEAAKSFSEGLAAVKIRGKWGFIDKREILVVQPLYDETGTFTNGACLVRQGTKWGIINARGKLIQQVKSDQIKESISGLWISEKDGFYGLIDRNGKTLLFPKYERVQPLKNDLVIVKRRGLYGVVNMEGVIRIPFLYKQLLYSEESDTFMALIPGKWRTYNKEQLSGAEVGVN